MSPTKKRLIHGHIKHQERTADHNYVIRLSADRAAKAHTLLQDIFQETTPDETAMASPVDECASDKPAEPSPKETSADSEPAKTSQPKETTTSEQHSPVVAASIEETSEDDDDDKPLKLISGKRRALDSSEESDSASAAASVTSLSHEHKSVLLTVFNDEISSGKLLTVSEVRTKMRAHMFLYKMVVRQEFVKVSDFVRYKTNHTRQMQLSQLTDMNDEYCFPSVSAASGLRPIVSRLR